MRTLIDGENLIALNDVHVFFPEAKGNDSLHVVVNKDGIVLDLVDAETGNVKETAWQSVDDLLALLRPN